MTSTDLHFFSLPKFDVRSWSYGNLLRFLPPELSSLSRRTHKALIDTASVNEALLAISSPTQAALVTLRLDEKELHIGCSCGGESRKLCVFQVQGILNLMENPDVRIFFDEERRKKEISLIAGKYGLDELENQEDEFVVQWKEGRLEIIPTNEHLQSADEDELKQLARQLIPPARPKEEWREGVQRILVWTQSRFQENFYLAIFEAIVTENGSVRGPLKRLHAVDLLLEADTSDQLKFYGAVAKFQDTHRTTGLITDRQAYYWLLKNPEHLPVYIHNFGISEALVPQSLRKVDMVSKEMEMSVSVHQAGQYYEVVGELTIEGRKFDLLETRLRYGGFLLAGDRLHFIERDGFKELLEYLQKHRNKLVLHKSKFELFRKEVLEKVEHYTRVVYTFLKPATRKQRREVGLDEPAEKIIYLDDAGQFVHITPVVRYGPVELPVLSPRILYMVDHQGQPFQAERDNILETDFATTVLLSHPTFPEQIGQDHVYLHKSKFLDETWFPPVFEKWEEEGITIHGFEKIKNNRYSPHRARVSVSVVSGIDWFEIQVQVSYGREIVPLRQLYTSVRNKTRYVTLSNGRVGILPEEWLEKLREYFRIGEVDGEILRTSRTHFMDIAQVYAEEYLSPSVRTDIEKLAGRLEDFSAIPEVAIPAGLKSELRGYQYEGLKWLNFMSQLKFGACIADDMGLGKTIQVIAFLLLEKERTPDKPTLIVVPASLLFNWQLELKKHAPDLTSAVYNGANRMDYSGQCRYDLILTTYSIMVGEIHKLRNYSYHYVILDESQNIKNPASQRYKAACQLRAGNRIIMTGTPIENNTYDLYGQFSFLIPGLLGSRRYFKDQYFMPINKFRESRKIEELQSRIRPFMLRRTKEQVANQLPRKKEIVMYCEMGDVQQRVYKAYAEEFRNYLSGRSDGDISREKLHILQGLTKLRQICISPALLNDEEYYGTDSSKIAVLVEQLEGLVSHHKVLVFSQFVTALDLVKKELEERGIGYSYLVGATTGRGKVVQEFQEDPARRVFLISLKAGGAGLNLTEADYVFLLDPWWNPATENQAIDRTHRIGQDKEVMAIRLIVPGTIEERVLELQANKKELTDELVRAEESLVKDFDKDILLRLV